MGLDRLKRILENINNLEFSKPTLVVKPDLYSLSIFLKLNEPKIVKYPNGKIFKFDKRHLADIKYKISGDTLIINMVLVSNKDDRGKGYASMLLDELIRLYNPRYIKPDTDGFTNQGKRMFRNYADRKGYVFDKNTIVLENY